LDTGDGAPADLSDASVTGNASMAGDAGSDGSGRQVLTFDTRVAASADDAEQDNPNSMALVSDTDLDVDYAWIAARFRAVTVPPGATIVNAHVTFHSQELAATPGNLTVHAQATDDAGEFSDLEKLSDRPRTSGIVWNLTTWEADTAYASPNIASVVQAIIDRPGWQVGNAFVILFAGPADRDAESFDGAPNRAATLHVEYQ
jgi:hypothetical protein